MLNKQQGSSIRIKIETLLMFAFQNPTFKFSVKRMELNSWPYER